MNKLNRLANILGDMERVAVALSGGVDSSFLTVFAAQTLGSENVLAITLTADNFAIDETEYTNKLCGIADVPHMLVRASLSEEFYENGKERCYYCKRVLFGQLLGIVNWIEVERNVRYTAVDGTNDDDRFDYRPGSRAVRELKIRSPLAEAGLTKADIRAALRQMGMDIWDKPAYACLASRIPCGTRITDEALASIFKLEEFLREQGFAQVRVRAEGSTARIELEPSELTRFGSNAELMSETAAAAREVGFRFAALDLSGYRTGNMN